MQRLGDRIVDNWKKDPAKWPGGPCIDYTYKLARIATAQLGGAPFPKPYSSRYAFCALWGSHIDIGKERWLQLPDECRGRGAPGAMMYEGRGTKMMGPTTIFSGGLEPGAVIQVWTTAQDYLNVVNGIAVEKGHKGHSFFFREYVYKAGAIAGMKVIDAKFHGNATVTRGTWGYWVATNVRCIGHTFTEPMPWPTSAGSGSSGSAPTTGGAYGA
jgi:hypothetical protein